MINPSQLFASTNSSRPCLACPPMATYVRLIDIPTRPKWKQNALDDCGGVIIEDARAWDKAYSLSAAGIYIKVSVCREIRTRRSVHTVRRGTLNRWIISIVCRVTPVSPE